MATVSLIAPLDQPVGTRRLLHKLRDGLADTRFSQFRLIVAYAKSGPLHRLKEPLEEWRASKKTIEAIIGIDQRGTSREALELALVHFDATYVTQEVGITFHPKIYLFKGSHAARVIVGSNNLTVGGTETNFEAAIQLDLDLPADDEIFATFERAWTDLLPISCPATVALDLRKLKQLISNGFVVDERVMRQSDGDDEHTQPLNRRPSRSGLLVKPASPLPKAALAANDTNAGRNRARVTPSSAARARATARSDEPATARRLAMQIKPHHNGEIFLSVTAARQDPGFFRWPFTGSTVPKKRGNPSYPQLSPDPVVNITVYGAQAAPLLTLGAYALNTVYYERNSEIRVTASPLVAVVPDYSVMIMERSESDGVDYELVIHRPDSPDYAGWVSACNQTMPGGGQTARKYGWF